KCVVALRQRWWRCGRSANERAGACSGVSRGTLLERLVCVAPTGGQSSRLRRRVRLSGQRRSHRERWLSRILGAANDEWLRAAFVHNDNGSYALQWLGVNTPTAQN